MKKSDYKPTRAVGAHVDKKDESWTLVLTRTLRHPPALVWRALTEPEQLLAWAPFDANQSLAQTGTVVLSTVGAPDAQPAESTVTRAVPERLLEFGWGGNTLRWELKAQAGGTLLTLWHSIPRNYISWGAAGWHICLDVLSLLLDGTPIGRIVGAEAMKFDWKRLNHEYAEQFGLKEVEFPNQGE